MVFQDGEGYIHRDGNNPALNVIDNLIAQNKIPVMICVFINPGDSPSTRHANLPLCGGLRRKMASHSERLHAQHAI